MVVLLCYLNKRQKNEKGRMQIGRIQMLRLKNILIMLFMAVITAGSVNAADATGLIWSDEFNGTSVDTSKWIIWDEADGSDSWFSPANVSVSGGVLTIANKEQLRADGRHWTGGHLDATFHPQYKYLDARCRITKADTCVWPAWWTVGWANNTWVWPPEFDIFEFMGYNDGTNHFGGQWYHYNTAGGYATYQGKDLVVSEGDWHTYGVDWTAAGPVFYVDEYKTVTPGLGGGAQTTQAALMKLTSSPNAYGRSAGCPLSDFQVDWVRVYDNPPTNGSTPPTDGTISMNKPAYCSSGGAPNSANDGKMDTRWESDYSDPQWIYFDLEGTKTITQVVIYWETAAAKAYQIQTSNDATNWTTVWSTTTGTSGATQTINLNVSAAYIRMYGTARTTGYGYSIWEFKVYGSAGGNTPPTVSITAPANGATYTAPASVTINATAADSDGTVSKVDFYQGSTLLGTDTTSPYSYSWTSVAAGSYSLTAKATDNLGATTTSSAVGITVNAAGNTPPTVSITAPANGATYTAPASVTINATAADPGGSVSKVDFYQGATLLGTDTTSPYSYSWTNVAAGSYSLTAKATDNGGAVTTSAAVGITVNAAGGATLLSQGKPVTVSSTEYGTGANAVDGSMTTRWGSAFSDPQWIYVDLGATHTITQVILEWEGTSAYGKSYQIQTSANASTWTTVYTTTTGNGGNDTLAVSGSGRYVRMYGTARGTGYGYSIWEFKVYGN
jgi:hypothetical protein